MSKSTSKQEHYESLLLSEQTPTPHRELLASILPFLPEPSPLDSLLPTLRDNLTSQLLSQTDGTLELSSNLTSLSLRLGEVGLDKTARIPLPADWLRAQAASSSSSSPSRPISRLSPFKTPLSHQHAILTQQVKVLREVLLEAQTEFDLNKKRLNNDRDTMSDSEEEEWDGKIASQPPARASDRRRPTAHISLHGVSLL